MRIIPSPFKGEEIKYKILHKEHSTIYRYTVTKPFKTIGLIGRQRKEDISDTLQTLKTLLQARQLKIVVEEETAAFFAHEHFPIYPRNALGKHCDLIIVVGGDGSLLNAARAAIDSQIPIVGINRGRLGFLTDIKPDEINTKVAEVLDGHYREEQRFVLNAYIEHANASTTPVIALNDVVLLPGDVAHMIEFSIFINDQFVCSHRADGMIIATPTGSTAYALSGGGPILHPNLAAIVLVPMFPHTLSARPIVVEADSRIRITIADTNETPPRLSCDGQAPQEVPLGATIHISRKAEALCLIHPLDYNYFETLRLKLQWNTRL